MADGETEHQYNLGQFKIVQDNLRKLYANLSKWESSVLISTKPALHLVEGNIGDPRAALSTYLIRQWTIRDLQRRAMRIFIYALFAAGLSLLALPAVFTFSSYGTRSQAAFHLISAADKEDVSPILAVATLAAPSGFYQACHPAR